MITSKSSLALVVCFSWFFLSAAQTMAGPPGKPPYRDDCDDLLIQDYEDKGDWINARIDCRQQNINSRLWDLVDEIDNAPPGLFPEKQKQHFRNERVRAETERIKNFNAGGFKGLAKKQDSLCQMMEYVGDGDGICEPGETCAEVIGDGIGNDDGECKPLKGKKKEVCVQICDQDTTDSIDDNFDDDTFDRVEENYKSIDSLMNETHEYVNQSIIALNKISAAQNYLAGLGEGDCADLLHPEGLPDPKGRRSYDVMLGTLIGANVGDWAHAACDSGAEQTGFGFNMAGVCTVLAVAAGVVDSIHDAYELHDDTLTGMRLDAALKCLEQMDAQMRETLTKLGNVDTLVKDLTVLVETKFQEVNDLLNTPQGLRPSFPQK